MTVRRWRAAAVGACAVTWAAGTPAQEPSLADVLARASAYVEEYERQFSALVAEEQYFQEVRTTGNPTAAGRPLSRENPGGGSVGSSVGSQIGRRTLRSDYLLVQLGSGAGWVPFRDVFELDGKPVRDREDRLFALFMTQSFETSMEQAERIMAESARYNIGTVWRSINTPTLALTFLHADTQPRFEFRRRGRERVAGREAWVLEYRETERPTLIKTNNERDLPVTGRLWVDPATGLVLRTNVVAADPFVRATVTVTFREDEDLELWVPGQMDEHYRAARTPDIHGRATYMNYRRFQVTTDEAIRRPPGVVHQR